MEDLDIDKLVAGMSNPDVGANAMGLLDMLQSANKVLGQVEQLMNKFESMGLKPLLVRGAGAKLNIDAESPLKTDNMVVPSTAAHRQIFEQLNTMNEHQLAAMFVSEGEDGETTDQSATNTD